MNPNVSMLLFFSRQSIPTDQIEAAQLLAEEVDDWDWVSAVAKEKFSAPFLYENLTRMTGQRPWKSQVQRFREAALLSSIYALKIAHSQREFLNQCVVPLGIPYLFLKGTSLASRYYKQPALRYSRDIDLLTTKSGFGDLLTYCFLKGYPIYDGTSDQNRVTDRRDLDAILRFSSEACVMTEEGTAIEVHNNIDKGSGIFATDELLRVSEEFQSDTDVFNVLPVEHLFPYVIYHNTRHTWSNLHWLSDLDAMITHQSFNEHCVLNTAESYGLKPLALACIGFHKVVHRPELTWKNGVDRSAVYELLEMCVQNILGDETAESRLRSEGWGDIISKPGVFMERREARRAQARRTLDRFRPRPIELIKYRLPRFLFFLYFPLRLLRRIFGWKI